MKAAQKKYERILEAHNNLEMAENNFLQSQGWLHTCNTADSCWYWENTIGDKRYLCDKSTALSLAEALIYR